MHLTLERPHWLRSTWVSAALLAGAAVVGLGFLRIVDPRIPGNYPSCPFLFATGCYCPGCGTLRALASLLEGDIRSALGYNPLTVLALPILAALAFSLWSKKTGRPVRFNFDVPHWAAWALLTAILGFWGLRNIPVYPFAMLAP